MWSWDQGRLPYFNFENLRLIAKASLNVDLKTSSHKELTDIVGLPFSPVRDDYAPWRNYQRIFKLMRLVTVQNGVAVPTPVATMLAKSGVVTSDEFISYIIRSHTDPNPALSNWSPDTPLRWPLLFSLKYLLACHKIFPEHICTLNEVISAYQHSGFLGNESEESFATLLSNGPLGANTLPTSDKVRQARESLKFMAQLSYLMMPNRSQVQVNLLPEQSADVFRDCTPVDVGVHTDPTQQILSLAEAFGEGANDEFGFLETEQDVVIQSGFVEGTKVQKTHLVIERNRSLRTEFFKRNPTSTCDVCKLKTKKTYHWTKGVLDVHHILPLSSGVEIDKDGTRFDDLRPLCPTCHRATHSFYSVWLKNENKRDFLSREEAVAVYLSMKEEFNGTIFDIA